MVSPIDQHVQVWRRLASIADPEIPVISLVDLGVIREVQVTADGDCCVAITPTYSGCPAMQHIRDAIEVSLQSTGLRTLKIETRLSPPWTTDWISEDGKHKLKQYGIAPPHARSTVHTIDTSGLRRRPLSANQSVECPQCGSIETRCLSSHGSTACKALYRCSDCLEPFEYFKPI